MRNPWKDKGRIASSASASRQRMLAVTAVLTLGAVSLTACGSGTDSGSSADTITIMVEGAISGPVYALPEMVTGASAAVKRINDGGGINGKKITLITCDDQGNPNTAAECGRKAVSEGVVTVVGGLSTYDNRFIPSLEAAKIPYLGSTDQLPIHHTSPVSFPIISGAVTYVSGPMLLSREGCKKASILIVDQPGVDDAVAQMKSGFNDSGVSDVSVFKFATSTTDFSAAVGAATAKGAQCLELGAGPQALAGILLAMKKAGITIPVNVSAAAVLDSLLKPIGFPAGQLHAVGPYYLPGSDAGGDHQAALDEFVSDMKAMNKSGQEGAVDALSLNSYATTLMFADIAKGLSKVTGPSVLKALGTYKSVLPLTAPIDFGGKPVIADHPQVHATTSIAYAWDGSTLKVSGDPIVLQ